jgi:hypothetical protein
LNRTNCIKCGRDIVFAKRSDTHENIAMELIDPYIVNFDPIGWTAHRVEPLDRADKLELYITHSKVCQKEKPA